MFYRVAVTSANLIKVSLVTTAATLAICVLALVETTNTAGAISLPKNGKIAFVSTREDDNEIFAMRPDGTAVRQLTNNAAVTDLSPAWAPDGTRIAFVSHAGEPDFGIYVMNADGSNIKKLTDSPGLEGAPAWSPNGSKIAFTREVPAGEGQSGVLSKIFLMNADGSNQVQLRTGIPSGAGEFLYWSPDGSKIAFVSASDGQIYTVNVDGTGLTQLTDSYSYTIGSPEWSPDGTKILFGAYDSRTGGKYDIFVMNADGSEIQNLTNQPTSHDRAPTWSPDGRDIAFMRDQDGMYQGNDSEIWRMRADGSSVTQLTRNTAEDFEPDWQPLPPKSRSTTVHPPDTGGPSLLLVASALLFSGSVLLYAVVQRRM